ELLEIRHSPRDESITAGPSASIRHAVGGESPSKSAPTRLPTVAPPSQTVPWKPGQLHSALSWTHYRALLGVESREARDFYEIEAIRNGWSARQLGRQIHSLLFERLLKSRDKEGVIALANQGQIVTTPLDVIKDPYVL